MADSLEVRCPLLDHEIIEFAATILSSMKQGRNGRKLVLKDAAKSLLPESLLNKRKTGFSASLGSWFRGELSELLQTTLLGDRFTNRGFFQPAALRSMVDDHMAGRKD
jgi:asparagine synthase (glutamine-hydrolysing)